MSQKGYTLTPHIRNKKNLVYNDKKYVIDFDLLKKNSNYFYSHRRDYKGLEDIPIEDKNYKYSDDVIQIFTLCCQNKTFNIDVNNIYPLYRLSIIYEVEDLVSFIDSYIEKNRRSIAFQLLLFKIQILDSKDIFDVSCPAYDLKPNEDLISQYFIEYIDNDEFLLLPVQNIYRIIHNSNLYQKKLTDQDQMKIVNFLCKCMDKYDKEASILLLDIDFISSENAAIVLIRRLLDKYSNIIDVNMINPKFLMNFTRNIYDKYIEATKEKIPEISEKTTPHKKSYTKKNCQS